MVEQSLPDKFVSPKPIGVVMVLSNMQFPLGGTQKQLLGLANELESQGVSVWIVSRRQKIFKPARGGYGIAMPPAASRDHVYFVHLPILRLQPAWSFLVSFLVWAAINRKRFQIIHAHSPRLGIIASVVGWMLRKAVIIKVPSVEHAADVQPGRLMHQVRRRILIEGSAGFIAVSKELARHLCDAGISPGKIARIPNGVLLNGNGRPDYSKFKLEFLGSSETPMVLYVGRLVEEKGLDQLLRVWASLPARHGAVLVIVGDGPLRPALEAQVEKSAILRSVRFTGHQADVAKFYAIADLFVLPSKTEGMSNSLLEAMAVGLPVIASDTGGNKDVIENQSGVLVNWHNIPECVGVLTTLLTTPDLRSRLGASGKKRALNFNLPSIAKQYCRLYESVLQG
jgi:glycosyltransferase involved in cell wall biosynthesis